MVGVRNGNGRIYPRDVIVKALERVKLPLPGGFVSHHNDPIIPTMTQVSHEVTRLEFVGTSLLADISTLNTPMGQKLCEMIAENSAEFRTSGTGQIATYGTVAEFELCQISTSSIADAAKLVDEEYQADIHEFMKEVNVTAVCQPGHTDPSFCP